MAAQTTYGFSTPKGIPGGLYDISYHEVNTRMNEEADGKLGFGIGVVRGTSKGVTVKLPAAASPASDFEGVVINGVNVEQDMSGKVIVKKDATVGIVRFGKVWAKVSDKAQNVKYGDSLYLILDGDEVGSFTNAVSAGEDTATRVLIKGTFIGGADNGIAPILLPNELN